MLDTFALRAHVIFLQQCGPWYNQVPQAGKKQQQKNPQKAKITSKALYFILKTRK